MNKEETSYLNEMIYNLEVSDLARKGGYKYLRDAWKRFVQEVKEGYKLTSDDYYNDLSVRTILQNIIDTIDDQNLKEKIKMDLSEDDKMFKKFLVNTDRCVWRSDAHHKDWFWIWGVPKNARDELKEDLKNEGWEYYNQH